MGGSTSEPISAEKVPHPYGQPPFNDVHRLVVLAPNWLGDAVMALPAIADLRRAAPEAFLAVAARPNIGSMFSLVRTVDAVIDLAGRTAADILRGHQFDAAILLPNSFQSALAVWRAGIPERWGYRADYRAPLLTRAIPRPVDVHQGAYYQHLVAALGAPSGRLEPRIDLDESQIKAGADVLTRAGWDGGTPLVAIAPGSANGAAKRWPSSSFAALARDLEASGIRTVIVGSSADRAVASLVLAAAAPTTMIDLVGRTDLPVFAGVLKNCRALVTNDSGGMHLAAALGVPVTALFGPSDERFTHPLGPAPQAVLINEVWCRPCMLQECPLTHRCLRGISVETTLEATRRFL